MRFRANPPARQGAKLPVRIPGRQNLHRGNRRILTIRLFAQQAAAASYDAMLFLYRTSDDDFATLAANTS